MNLYYNANGHFVAFNAYLNESGLSVPEGSEPSLVSKEVAENLGIPGELMPVGDYWNASSYNVYYPSGMVQWYNRTYVRLSSDLFDNRTLSRCNVLGAIINDDSQTITYLESWLFVWPDISTVLTPEDAVLVGRESAVRLLGQAYDKPAEESIEGIRLDTETLRFGYEYSSFWGYHPDSGWTHYVIAVIDCENGSVLYTHVRLSILQREESRIAFGPSIAFLGILAAGSVLLVGLVLFSPDGAIAILGPLVVPLFMWLRGTDVLRSFNRGKIFGYIMARPGVSFSELKAGLSISNGLLVYHLQVLERLELIRSEKEGKARRYYPIGVPAGVDNEQHLGTTESRVLSQVVESGQIRNSELAKMLGISRQKAHYNLKLLHNRGLVEPTGSAWRAIRENREQSQ